MQKKDISRRGFIKSSIAASAALSFPNIVPSTVFGADAPSNRVHVGLIGCGNIGTNYHSNYLKKMQDVRVVAVCDAYKSRRLARAADFNRHYSGTAVTKAHADFRELIARSDIDAQTKRVITWDPKKEQIVGDKDAAKMITRPYRKEWKVW